MYAALTAAQEVPNGSILDNLAYRVAEAVDEVFISIVAEP
jgi:hypothetical protein